MQSSTLASLACIALLSLAGCAAETDSGDDGTSSAEDLSAGINGTKCRMSAYNCALEADGNSRVPTNDPKDNDHWHVKSGQTILDGNGDKLAVSTDTDMLFNYGQVREFGGKKYAFATSTSNHSTGWFPMDAILGESSFANKVGHVSAHSTGEAKMACYEIKSSDDETLAAKKVVYDADGSNERAGDYLPLVRKNGKRSANIAFVVPGFALGGTAIDHFPAGTKFQRVHVPTQSNAPSIVIPLYSKASNGHYTKQDGSMRFLYGYVTAKTGTVRYGWMAEDALEPSNGCK